MGRSKWRFRDLRYVISYVRFLANSQVNEGMIKFKVKHHLDFKEIGIKHATVMNSSETSGCHTEARGAVPQTTEHLAQRLADRHT